MTTTFSDQIMAIKDAMKEYPQKSAIYECLNDAASSVAALNITKDLPDDYHRLRALAVRVAALYDDANKHELMNVISEALTLVKSNK